MLLPIDLHRDRQGGIRVKPEQHRPPTSRGETHPPHQATANQPADQLRDHRLIQTEPSGDLGSHNRAGVPDQLQRRVGVNGSDEGRVRHGWHGLWAVSCISYTTLLGTIIAESLSSAAWGMARFYRP
jgi:hypothetical protein